MTVNINPLSAHLSCDSLLQRCREAKAKLEQLSHQLERHWFERYLLGKAAYTRLQADIRRVSEAIAVVIQAARVVQSTGQLEALRQLEIAIERLTAQETAVQAGLPRLPTVGPVDQVIAALTPAVGTIWEVMIRLGVPTTAFVWAVGALFAVGVVILLKATYQWIRIHLTQTRIKDRITLIEQINRILQIFERTEGEMHASETMALHIDTTNLRAETAALRKTVDTQAELQTATTTAINAVVDRLTKIEEILKAIKGKQS